MVYAGFWRRFCAYFIDGIIIGCLIYLLLIPFGFILGGTLVKDAEKPAAARHHSANSVVQKIIPVANDYTTSYPDYSKPNAAPVAAAPAPATAVGGATPVEQNTASPVPPAAVMDHVDSDTAEHVPYDGEGHHSMNMDEEEDDAEGAREAALLGMMMVVFYAVFFIGAAIYHTVFVASKWQATPGKRVMGCMVVTKDGKRLTYAHAFGRHIACALSMITVYIGFFLIGWTKQKTGLHDMVAGTRVVRYKNSTPVAATSTDEI